MIFIDLDPNVAETISRDDLSKIVANEGIIVNEFDKKRTYLDDKYNIINNNNKISYKAYNLRTKNIIQQLMDISNTSYSNISAFLKKTKLISSKNKNHRKVIYRFSPEELKYLFLIFKEKYNDKNILYYNNPKEGWEFLQTYFKGTDLKEYEQAGPKLRFAAKHSFDIQKISQKIYFKYEDKDKLIDFLTRKEVI